MSLSALFLHLLNFAAPAFFIALLLVLFSHIFLRKWAKPHGWIVPITMNFIVGCAMLVSGMLLYERDGRMLTYGLLVLGSASSQWLILRAWRG